MYKLSRSERGFTLTEIMVALAIFAILTAIAIPMFMKQREKATILQVDSALIETRTELVQSQLMNKGTFPMPGGSSTLPSGITAGQEVTTRYWRSSDGKKICLEGKKKNITRYLDTVSRKTSTASCTSLVN